MAREFRLPPQYGEQYSADASSDQLAPCRDNPELFFVEAKRGPRVADVETAKAICHTCALMQRCLETALTNREEYGVWGGATPSERSEIMAKRVRQARRRSTGSS